MEKVLSNSEKIRRAEEIYARRRGIEKTETVEKENNYKIYKFLFKTLLLLNIVILVWCIQNKSFIFSESFLAEFSKYSENINSNINNFIQKIRQEEANNKDTSIQESINENYKSIEGALNIAKASKEEISFIKPVEGVVSSGFGDRDSKYQNVKGYHTGIDIAAVSGTKIVASMEGEVTQVSSQGDYGNHLKIAKENIETLYAHCSKIYVNEGDYINQGQEIAEVGSTRK